MQKEPLEFGKYLSLDRIKKLPELRKRMPPELQYVISLLAFTFFASALANPEIIQKLDVSKDSWNSKIIIEITNYFTILDKILISSMAGLGLLGALEAAIRIPRQRVPEMNAYIKVFLLGKSDEILP